MPRRKVKKRRKQRGGGGLEEPLLQKNPMHEKGGGENKGSLIPKNEKKTGFNNEKFKKLTGKASAFASSLGFPGMCIMAAFITASIFFIIALAHISSGNSSTYLLTTYSILLCTTIFATGFYFTKLLKQNPTLISFAKILSPALSVIACLAFILHLNLNSGKQLSIVVKYVPPINATNILIGTASMYQVYALWKFFHMSKEKGYIDFTKINIITFLGLFILNFGLTIILSNKITAYFTDCPN